jgi:hypothetical protein
MADRNNNGSSTRVSVRDKAAVVYSPKTTFTGNSSISVDRGFTVRFTEQESNALEQEQSAMRDRLTGTHRNGG